MQLLSFNINNIQNPLQRYYRRGQTVLPFEQNLLETDEIKKKKKEKKMIKTFLKGQYSSNCIVPNPRFS